MPIVYHDATYTRAYPAIIAAAIATTWSLMVFCVRVYLRLSTKRSFGPDDVACAVGMLFGVGSTSATLISVHNGLGQHQDTLSSNSLQVFMQSTYAASLLYILAICASKCSAALLVARLKPAKRNSLSRQWVTYFTLSWATVSTLLIAFECSLPDPWNTTEQNRCSNLFAKWVIIEVFSCLIEAMLFGLAANMLWDLQMPFKSKALVLSIFSCRFLIIIPTVFRIIYLKDILAEPDETYNSVLIIIATQVVLHYSLMAATFPCLKPFLAAFDKELLDTSKLQSPMGGSYLRSRRTQDKSYELHSVDKHLSHLSRADANFRLHNIDLAGGISRTNVQGLVTPAAATHRLNTDARSTESDGSDVMIIRKTQEWHITTEIQR
ncbi:hypothetical protein MMC29_004299 [Sticta canariensis]|nr:hypothetical protein [Sticta canariensis]